MGRIWMPGVSDGADLDAITAAAGDVLKGKVIVDQDGNPLTGILELTGSAADSQVLAGKTYYNTDAKTKRTGTMPNQGAVAPGGLNAGGSYTIPAGYHNGQGKVTANSLASQTDANAAAGDILSGKTAWVKGSKVTGTMANRSNAQVASKMAFWSDNNLYLGFPQGAYLSSDKDLGVPTVKVAWQDKTVSPGASQTTVSPDANKVLRNVTVNAVSGLSAGNIKQGATVGGVAGNFTNDANAAAGDILSGKTAYVKGSKLTGTLATMAGQTITPSASQQTVSCSGKKMTGNVVINGDADLVSGNILRGKNIFNVAGSNAVLKVVSGSKSINSKNTIKWGSGGKYSSYYIQIDNIGITPVNGYWFEGLGNVGSCIQAGGCYFRHGNAMNVSMLAMTGTNLNVYDMETMLEKWRPDYIDSTGTANLTWTSSKIILPCWMYGATMWYWIYGY